MGFNTNSGTVEVTVTGVTFTKNDILFSTANRDAAGTTTLGTVPANKVWRVIAILGNEQSTGAVVGKLDILFNNVAVMHLDCQGLALSSPSSNNAWNGSYYDAIVLTAGQEAKITVTGNHYASATIIYFEEAAP